MPLVPADENSQSVRRGACARSSQVVVRGGETRRRLLLRGAPERELCEQVGRVVGRSCGLHARPQHASAALARAAVRAGARAAGAARQSARVTRVGGGGRRGRAAR
eukprot:scaffold1607_cov417-Prasinococcus_capsulatus_cf.AAC.12